MNDRENEKKTDKDGLFIPSRQVSILVVVALAIACIVFLGGYFIGKKHMMEQFVARIEQDSFADQVYSSLCDLYDYDMEETSIASQPLEEQQLVEHSLEEQQLDQERNQKDTQLVSNISADNETEQKQASVEELQSEQAVAAPSYYAQLLSYHSKRYADIFVQKLMKKNIPVEVRTRKSVTARGESKPWYQVVTKPYTDREELQVLVDRVSREEKIKGACIKTC